MGLFQRRLKTSSDLSSVSSERLMSERVRVGAAGARLEEIASTAPGGTINADEFVAVVQDAGLCQAIDEELRRRGLLPPA